MQFEQDCGLPYVRPRVIMIPIVWMVPPMRAIMIVSVAVMAVAVIGVRIFPVNPDRCAGMWISRSHAPRHE